MNKTITSNDVDIFLLNDKHKLTKEEYNEIKKNIIDIFSQTKTNTNKKYKYENLHVHNILKFKKHFLMLLQIIVNRMNVTY